MIKKTGVHSRNREMSRYSGVVHSEPYQLRPEHECIVDRWVVRTQARRCPVRHDGGHPFPQNTHSTGPASGRRGEPVAA